MDEISKRTFLAAGLAATLPLTAPSLEARAAEPGRKLGYAILGLGYYATKIIMPRFAECEHSKLVALVSGTPEKLKTFGEQYGIPESHRYSYETFDRIADNPDARMPVDDDRAELSHLQPGTFPTPHGARR